VYFRYIPECGIRFTGVELQCSVSDLLSVPAFTFYEVYHYGINILSGLLPIVLPCMIAGVLISILLSLLKGEHK